MNTAPAPAATAPAVKAVAPATKASTKAPAKKVTAAKKEPAKNAAAPVKAPATKAAAPAKKPSVRTPTVAERDMKAYDEAVQEYKTLKKDVSVHFSAIAYQARRATPTEGYAKTHEEALAKLTSAVAAYREVARLFAEVAPSK